MGNDQLFSNYHAIMYNYIKYIQLSQYHYHTVWNTIHNILIFSTASKPFSPTLRVTTITTCASAASIASTVRKLGVETQSEKRNKNVQINWNGKNNRKDEIFRSFDGN